MLLHEPHLLVIDELSLGLAPSVVEHLLETIERLKGAGQAMIIVEQSLNVAVAVADRAVFMDKGGVRFEGPAAELLQRDEREEQPLHAIAEDHAPELAHVAAFLVVDEHQRAAGRERRARGRRGRGLGGGVDRRRVLQDPDAHRRADRCLVGTTVERYLAGAAAARDRQYTAGLRGLLL